MQNYFKSRIFKRGFSLVELSITLTIMAIIAGTVISSSITRTDIVKRRQTLKKMEIIEKAIANFVALNDRLPCPADPSTTVPNAGLEWCWSTRATNSYTSPTGLYVSSTYFIFGGIMPYSTLALPKEFSTDGWGNYFSYIMFADLGGFHGGYGTPSPTLKFENSNMGTIQINDITGSTITNQAVYAIVSHGPNGYGSWLSTRLSSTQNPFPSSYDASEMENAHTVNTWNNIFVAADPTATFDDIVHYKTKWQVVKEAGYVISNTACTVAKTVINTAEVTINGGVYHNLCGKAPGDPYCANYFTLFANKINSVCLNQ